MPEAPIPPSPWSQAWVVLWTTRHPEYPGAWHCDTVVNAPSGEAALDAILRRNLVGREEVMASAVHRLHPLVDADAFEAEQEGA